MQEAEHDRDSSAWYRGSARTIERKATATGGTTLVEDRCDGTARVTVKRYAASVKDLRLRKTFALKAGKSYVAGVNRHH
jgi:hypothetical protein